MLNLTRKLALGTLMALAVVGLGGCEIEAEERVSTTNPDVPVELLFTHQGCEVYRFEDTDGGRGPEYYPNCRAITGPDTTKDITIELLFTHKGCKVFRFRDHGNWVHYANCLEGASTVHHPSTGPGRYAQHSPTDAPRAL